MRIKPRKGRRLRLVFAVGLSVMIIGAWQFAAAEDPAFSKTLYAEQPPELMLKETFQSFSLLPRSTQDETSQGSMILTDLLTTEELKLSTDESSRKEWMPLEIIGPRYHFEPVRPYLSSPDSPLLGFGWDNDAVSHTRWNIVFGPGLYISNHRNWHYSSNDFGLEEPVSAHDRMDLMEKIQNALQDVGFQIRYDF